MSSVYRHGMVWEDEDEYNEALARTPPVGTPGFPGEPMPSGGLQSIGSLPTASEQALTWQAWNAHRNRTRNIRKMQARGLEMSPLQAPGQTRREKYREEREWKNSWLPSINTISSPGVY